MAKKGQKQNQAMSREDKLRWRLAEAQSDLQQAQEKRVQVMQRGERDVEKARQQAARRLAKATQRVEKRTRVVSGLESRILAARTPDASSPFPPPSSVAVDGPAAMETKEQLVPGEVEGIEAADANVEAEVHRSSRKRR